MGQPQPFDPWLEAVLVCLLWIRRQKMRQQSWLNPNYFLMGLPKQSCIILIPETNFCQGIMGNLICPILELKKGKTILYFFWFVFCKWRIKFSLSLWYHSFKSRGFQLKQLLCTYCSTHITKPCSSRKDFFLKN